MGKKLKLGILALVGVLGLAAFAPTAKADEGRFDHGDRFDHGERFGRLGQGERYHNDWRRERFERSRGEWNRGGWGHYYRYSPYYNYYR
jgi:hypothetical protein